MPAKAKRQIVRKVTQTEVRRFLDAWLAVRQFIQSANFNRFQGAGLSATQFMTLNLLPARGAGVAMGELARRMNLSPATVAKTVDSLEARDLALRTRRDGDKRVVTVEITEAGVKLQNAAQGEFEAQIRSAFKAMDAEEREGLVEGLEAFVRAVAKPTVEAPTAAAPALPMRGATASRRAARGAAVEEKRSSPRSARR